MILYNETNYVDGKSQFLSADGNPVKNGSVRVLFSGSEVSRFSLDSAGFGTPSIESGKTYSFEVLDSSGNVANTLSPVMLGDFGGGGGGGDVASEKAERMAADNALSSRIDSKMDRGSLDNELNTLRNKDAELQNSINGSKYQLDAETARAQNEESALGTRIDGVENDVEAIDTRLTTAESDIDSLESSVDALYNTEVAQTDGETSVSSSTSGKVKTFVVGLASAIKTKIEAAYSHISDAVKHITATERSEWGTAYTHSQTSGNPHGTTIEEIDGLRTELTTIESDVSAIEGVIPSEATTSNKLADKGFVNSSIASQTAYFRGTFDIVDDLGLTHGASNAAIANALASVVSVVTPNDYTFVIDKDTDGNVLYKRFKYSNSVWQYEYTLNNSSFTAAQWAAIQSGITAEDVADIGYNTTARHSHSNKNLLDTYTQSNANIADAVAKKHEHANKTVLDNISSSDVSSWNAKATPTDITNAINALDVSDSAETNQFVTKVSETDGKISVSRTQPTIANVSGLQAALDRKADKSTVGDFRTKSQHISMGANLVVNGNGRNGDNYNFTSFKRYPTIVTNGAACSFGFDGTGREDEYMSCDFTKKILVSVDIKNLAVQPVTPTHRIYIEEYDIDKKTVQAVHVMYGVGTLTELTQDLKPGDTVVHLNDLSNNNWKSSTSYHRGFIFWNYKNSFGYQYEPETYSRNIYPLDDSNPLWEAANVDQANNIITLNSPWSGPLISAGTKVSRRSSGNTYPYPASELFNDLNWHHMVGTMNGVASVGRPERTNKFSQGVVYFRVGVYPSNLTVAPTTDDKRAVFANLSVYELPDVSKGINGTLPIANGGTGNSTGKAPTAGTADRATADASGNNIASTYATKSEIPDVSGKADKVSGATANHFAGLNSSGNLIDSGKKASDFATAAQGTKADTAYQKPSGGIPKTDLATSVQTSLGKAETALQSESDPVFTASAAHGITSANISSWNAKQDAITDINAIRNNAENGQTAYGWGNHANAGYLTDADLSRYAKTDGSNSTGTWDNITAGTAKKLNGVSTSSGSTSVNGLYIGDLFSNSATTYSKATLLIEASVAGSFSSMQYMVHIERRGDSEFKFGIMELSARVYQFDNSLSMKLRYYNARNYSSTANGLSYWYLTFIDSSGNDIQKSYVKFHISEILNSYNFTPKFEFIQSVPTTTDAIQARIPLVTYINGSKGSSTQPVYVNSSGQVNACGFSVKIVSTIPAQLDANTLYIS